MKKESILIHSIDKNFTGYIHYYTFETQNFIFVIEYSIESPDGLTRGDNESEVRRILCEALKIGNETEIEIASDADIWQ